MIQDRTQSAAGLEALALSHGVSMDAARHMLRALEAGGGTMAQFDHPEFGGMGQWFAGGMVMVGRMNDHALKARVSALCEDLASRLPARGWRTATASSSRSQSSSAGGLPGFEVGSGHWWPGGLGRPASVGAQNATRYAYFPESRRLAVETGGRVALYDTGDHVITGVAQQQDGASPFVFSGPDGTVSLTALRRIDPGSGQEDREGAEAPARAPCAGPHETAQEAPRPVPEPSTAASAVGQASGPAPGSVAAVEGATEVLAVLERLAELHRKGILTDAEFQGKKTELLARL